MNQLLEKDQSEFITYFEKFENSYFLFEVDIYYEKDIQDFLYQFVPSLRKDFIKNDQLSRYQKLVKN